MSNPEWADPIDWEDAEEAAIHAKRQTLARVIDIIEQKKRDYADPAYAGGPVGAFGEIFACNEILAAISGGNQLPQRLSDSVDSGPSVGGAALPQVGIDAIRNAKGPGDSLKQGHGAGLNPAAEVAAIFERAATSKAHGASK